MMDRIRLFTGHGIIVSAVTMHTRKRSLRPRIYKEYEVTRRDMNERFHRNR
jgi:hypothetical protein